ncbi:dienelactone hydrolase family protein [Reyranella sp.]|uniref:dienelactone hydrolase family protein n=1 Tax=Reyranella sp. TaxID=1929291 RepID=UPI003BA988B5
MGEEIRLTAADGGQFAAYLALPARTPAPGLVLLPEVFNTNPHIRSVADGYAAAGYVVLAPDVFWRQEPACYAPYTDEGRAKVAALRARLDTDQFARDLGDVVDALRGRADTTEKVGIMGFCLGGKFAYLAATRLPVDAAVSYYGVEIDNYLDEADRLRCPLLMHFAEHDPHVPPPTVAAIKARMGAWTNVTIHDYPGTEHGFNRKGYPPFQEEAAALARERTLAHFRRLLA